MQHRIIARGLIAATALLSGALAQAVSAQDNGGLIESDPMAPPSMDGLRDESTGTSIGGITDEEYEALLRSIQEDKDSLNSDLADVGGGVRAGDHAPIGVLQDHLRGQGQWMLSYRYMSLDFAGNRTGLERADDADVLSTDGGFPEAPTKMTKETHLFGLMYGVTDSVTVTAYVPFVDQEMDHVTRSGARYTTESSGVADVTVAALVKVYEDNTTRAHLNLGFSAPTGSITESDVTAVSAPAESVLPYPMQLGSGTWDLRPGFTYIGQEPGWSWGTQAIATLRMGRNDRDYSLGDRYDITAWGAWHATDSLSFSTRMALSRIKNIDGADSELDAALVPTADPTLRAGTRLDAFVGVNAVLGAGNRLAVEAGWPLSQDLEGPQLEVDTMVTIGWQLTF